MLCPACRRSGAVTLLLVDIAGTATVCLFVCLFVCLCVCVSVSQYSVTEVKVGILLNLGRSSLLTC